MHTAIYVYIYIYIDIDMEKPPLMIFQMGWVAGVGVRRCPRPGQGVAKPGDQRDFEARSKTTG